MQLRVRTAVGTFEGERVDTRSPYDPDKVLVIRTKKGHTLSFVKASIVDIEIARDTTLKYVGEPEPRTAYPVLSVFDGAAFFEEGTNTPWTATLLDAPADAEWSAYRQAWMI